MEPFVGKYKYLKVHYFLDRELVKRFADCFALDTACVTCNNLFDTGTLFIL
jgi:hypothetical protein